MQKDYVISTISSVSLNPQKVNKAIMKKGIVDTILVYKDGSTESLGLGGYLDIGLIDTMKDLFVNFIGAVIFSIIGYFYVKHEGKGKLAASLIPQVEMNTKEENKEIKDN